jgi:hypothetical protein
MGAGDGVRQFETRPRPRANVRANDYDVDIASADRLEEICRSSSNSCAFEITRKCIGQQTAAHRILCDNRCSKFSLMMSNNLKRLFFLYAFRWHL